MTFGLPSLLKNKKIPTILGITILLVGVIVGVFLVTTQGNFALGLKAGPTSTPRQVKFSNISDTSFTVSWITDTSVSGYVKYGEGKTDQTLSDNRDQVAGSTGQYTTHYVTIRSLKPQTSYSVLIGSGSQTYDDNGSPYSLQTALVARGKTPDADTMSGKVVLPSGQPAPGVIVYVEIEGGSLVSALTKNSGVWSIPLSITRTKDLTSFLSYDRQQTKINLTIQGADLGTATATVTTANDNPVADITLGQNVDLSVANATPSAKGVLEQTLITIQSNTLSPSNLTVSPGQVITVSNQDTTPHNLTSEKKEFTTGVLAAGAKGNFSAPLTPGSYSFTDSLNPTSPIFKGVVLVQTIAPPPASSVTSTPSGSFANLGSLDSPEATLSVKLLTPLTSGETMATSSPEIKIQGPVGQKIKVTVRSTPQTASLTIGKDGIVNWTPPKGLAPGDHTVTLQYTDDAGVLQTITKKFTVYAAESPGIGDALPSFSATPSASPTVSRRPTPTIRTSMPSTASGVPESGILTPTLALFTLGLALFIGGLFRQIKIVPKENH